MKLGPGDSGFHRAHWPDALRELCEGQTVRVPPNLPAYSMRLYATLGVTAVVDESLPAFVKPCGFPERYP